MSASPHRDPKARQQQFLVLGFAELLGNQHMGETGLRRIYDFALVPRSALIQTHTAIVYQTARFQLVPAASSPC
jgi:hypothetical protein